MKNNFIRLTIIISAAAVIRFFSINQSLWLDEGVAAITVKDLTIIQYFANFLPGDFHPPLYFIIQKLFFTFFGNSELVLRLPAYISGILLVVVIYFIAKDLAPKGLNSIRAAILTATSPLLVYYSSEARSYSTTALIVCLNLYLLLLLKRSFSYKKLLIFILTVVLLVYLNYLAYFYIIISLLVLTQILSKKQKLFDLRVFLYITVAFFLMLPVFVILHQQLSLGANISTNIPGWEQIIGSQNPIYNIGQFFIKIVSGRVDFDYSVVTKILSVLGATVVFSILALKVYRRSFDIIFIIFVSCLVLVLTVSSVIPIYAYFRLLFLIPLLILVICSLQKNEKVSSIIFYLCFSLNCIFLFYFYMNPSFWREDWKGAVTYTQYLVSGRPDSLAVFATVKPYEAFTYYFAGRSIGSGESFVIKALPEYKKQEILKYQNIIYYDYLAGLTDPKGNTLSFIKSNYNEETGYSFNKVGAVRLFVKR